MTESDLAEAGVYGECRGLDASSRAFDGVGGRGRVLGVFRSKRRLPDEGEVVGADKTPESSRLGRTAFEVCKLAGVLEFRCKSRVWTFS